MAGGDHGRRCRDDLRPVPRPLPMTLPVPMTVPATMAPGVPAAGARVAVPFGQEPVTGGDVVVIPVRAFAMVAQMPTRRTAGEFIAVWTMPV